MQDKYKQDLLKKVATALQRREQSRKRGITPPQVKGSKTRPAKSYRNSSSIFITGSIGDFFALESFLTEEQRKSISRIVYATQKKSEIQTLFSSLSNFLSLKEHVSIWTDFSDRWCFFDKQECIRQFAIKKKSVPADLHVAEDFSILMKFPMIMNGSLTYNGSSFLKQKLAEISRFDLPKSYVVICPCSTDKRLANRDFDVKDWTECLKWLEKIGKKGVVLNTGKDSIPSSDFLIDLSNQTSINEAVEVLKSACGYIGIDSSLSVLATKLFFGPTLQVKSVNPHCYRYAKCYYAPQTDFSFMVREIKMLEHETTSNLQERSITLNVCQGVGDIFWVYQKFAPHFDRIHFCITHVNSGLDKVQNRAVDFLKTLPKVGIVSSRLVPPEEYQKLIASRYIMRDIMACYERGQRVFDYSCNMPLENGVRLEDIDPDYPIESNVEVNCQYLPMSVEPNNYVTVYISGATLITEAVNRHQLWSIETWFLFVKAIYQKYELKLPLVIIGASYDELAANRLCSMFKEGGFSATTCIDALAANVNYVLKNSYLLVAYQSGLSILADNFNVKQVMIYFPYLNPMLYTWCKRQHAEDGTFNAETFDKNPQQIIENLRLRLGDKE
jgi:ADP-heptose:LPS heptosyltransferase